MPYYYEEGWNSELGEGGGGGGGRVGHLNVTASSAVSKVLR